MIDYCVNGMCQNRGVCCPLYLNYSCQCLRDNYSGRSCETKINTTFLITSSVPSLKLFFSHSIEFILFILDCSVASIGLIPSSSRGAPLTFRSNQDIFISSDSQIDCSQTLSLTRKWTIRNWSAICSNTTENFPSIETTYNTLFIPARTLSNGIYELNLIVYITDIPDVYSSAFVYIEIIHSSLITNLISADTWRITQDAQKDLLLDPGQFSFDRDRITFDTDVNHSLRRECQSR